MYCFRGVVDVQYPPVSTQFYDSFPKARKRLHASNVSLVPGCMFWGNSLKEHLRLMLRSLHPTMDGLSGKLSRQGSYEIGQMLEGWVVLPQASVVVHLNLVVQLMLFDVFRGVGKGIDTPLQPYFRSPKVEASLTALKTMADRRLWPPLLFGSSVMSWYEHVGRSIYFTVCRNHQRWEWILKLFSRRRDLHFMIIAFTRPTHHSAWHTTHNVICGGAKLMDEYLEAIKRSRVVVKVI
ncbi:hypothetical protein IFM89_006510 [Coptis chinensis]|uniref:Uncharacterized protein n=1 Tax=Coptis chinensis TaxID=261450 RepID=A0A835IMJ6_9MAGN|nr:hypothetical protein IFM89_006510 [Coptis chinensis]